ncbi:CHRD superfamily [Fusarium coicis]|nr:CHRD superfamily [Fusarium coicis]
MKLSLLAVALSTLAAASPTPDMEHEKHSLGLLKPKGGIPFTFTSIWEVLATPDQVVDANNKYTGGLKNSKGLFKFGINSNEDVICYNITLYGFRGDYQSPANTATHIHEAVKGKSGPPRIAFPNPVGDEKSRNAVGCLKGPFRTGVIQNGQDTGFGFSLKQIEKNPEKFFADSHSSLAVPGAFRGQLSSGKVC